MSRFAARPGVSPLHRSLVLLILVACLAGCSQLAAPTASSPALLAESTAQPAPPEIDAESEGQAFILVEEVVIGLLFLAAVISIITDALRIPYTIGLVVVGLGLALFRQDPLQTPFTPEIILAILVPPLVFEAAFHIDFEELRRDLGLILLLAVPGVIVTMLLVGGMVYLGAKTSLYTALIFGALISATDPVAVIALFRSLGAPRRLQTLLEGESLLNDGTAIVLAGLVIALAGLRPLQVIGQEISAAGISGLLASIPAFLIVSGGGLLVGAVLGFTISALISRIDNYLIETTLTTALAFGAYLVAEHVLNVSGVLAVVAAGLSTGNTGPKGMSPTTRIVLFNFWEYAAFLANSFVFLLIGLEIDPELLIRNGSAIAWAILAVLVARAVSIYGLSMIGRGLPMRWKHILYWGGLRGAISLALVLSLPLDTPELGQMKAMAFGVVLFTLLFQGFTMGPLIRRLGLVQRNQVQAEFERRQAQSLATRAGYERLKDMLQQGLLSEYSWKQLAPQIERRAQLQSQAVLDLLNKYPGLHADELSDAWREALMAQRAALAALYRDGMIAEEVFADLVGEVDSALGDPMNAWKEIPYPELSPEKPIDRLIAVIVQAQDAESAAAALEKLGVSVTRLPTSGGFLGRRNVTLLIGLPSGVEALVIAALKGACRRRVEFVTTPVEGSPVPFSSPIAVSVGGAIIFEFEVEQYEEL